MIPVSHIVLMIYLAFVVQIVVSEEGITVACSAHNPCKVAFASHNPIILKCVGRHVHASIYWMYENTSNPNARPVTLVESQGLTSTIPLKILELLKRPTLTSGGDLQILSPEVKNTGVYTCKDGDAHLAYYEIDFQDAEDIYVSHASLGQAVQQNTTFDFEEGGSVEMFTVWEEWQPCDRCGARGERKKLGFCYARMNGSSRLGDKALPCGLMRAIVNELPSTHKLELRIEMCDGSCKEATSSDNNNEVLLLDNYYARLHADALLECPMASIYRPVSWEHRGVTLTRLRQAIGNSSYILDNTTGGGSLFIRMMNESDAGVYHCYVDQRLAGRFNVIFPTVIDSPGALANNPVETMIIGIVLFLMLLVSLSIAFACRKTCTRVVH